jgi:hypothetical protein
MISTELLHCGHDGCPETIDPYSDPNGTVVEFHCKDHGSSMTVDHTAKSDSINHPPHYTAHPSGVECIEITEHMGFCLGNAVKYIWRADLKHDAIEDLKKARWYIDREIARREARQ